MSTLAYLVKIIYNEKDDNYDVFFHNFPEIITAGKTLTEAWQNAKEALQLLLEGETDYPEPLSVKRSKDINYIRIAKVRPDTDRLKLKEQADEIRKQTKGCSSILCIGNSNKGKEEMLIKEVKYLREKVDFEVGNKSHQNDHFIKAMGKLTTTFKGYLNVLAQKNKEVEDIISANTVFLNALNKALDTEEFNLAHKTANLVDLANEYKEKIKTLD